MLIGQRSYVLVFALAIGFMFVMLPAATYNDISSKNTKEQHIMPEK
ncbi:hypothetical protein NTE_01006 [Candidatus Nitrososphaera evergladensis SR1]|uniref:Uncharacterized protein n=1 Tax=Candidatus Nitrososphaera evergladensis SR1 TaxID=1459636 RepID=A0A075MPL5_9ARCH|nr:hypothetical protein [Candidatus Nitrososphaera evergladensis]AIF83080.1 hypothetical protein NTE_01006 [Candidatus Nitrososphaera evergladensis SR1]